MKTKTILSVIVALLMVSSIAGASFMGNLADSMFKRVEPTINNAAVKQNTGTGILASDRQLCTSNAGCGTGTCTSCKCVAANALTGNVCLTECKAKCRTDCGTTGGSTDTGASATSCTTNADCTNGYCRVTSSSSSPIITTACVPCTANTQCGTGKICSSGNCVNAPANALQPFGGRCTTNAQCTSGRCSVASTAAMAAAGTCLCRTNTDCGTGKTCNTATGTCAATVKSLIGTGIKLNSGIALTGKATAIPLSNLKTGSGIITNTPVLPATGARCTTATQCTTKICKTTRSATTAIVTKSCATTCAANTDCETGKTCSSGRCVAGTTLKANGLACTASTQCASTYCDSTTRKCAAKPANAGGTKAIGAICTASTECASTYCDSTTKKCAAKPANAGGTTPKAIGAACTASTECESTYCDSTTRKCAEAPANAGGTADNTASSGTCTGGISACEASCELTCNPKITNGAACNNPAHCGNQCASGAFECACEGNTGTKTGGTTPKANGATCTAGTECASTYCDSTTGKCAANTGGTTPKANGATCTAGTECASTYCDSTTGKCAAMPVEALSPEVQTQVRTQLNTLEPKLERMELQVVADRLVASREALVALSARPDCYVTINDVELKAECLKIRFETVTDLLQSKGIFTADKAMELKTRVGGQGQAVAQERRAEIKASPPPAKTFTQRVKDVFRITGSFWRVTGGFVVDETEVQVGTAGEELRVIEAIPTDYLNDLNTQYSQLAALETDICSKYPTTLTSASVLKSCSTDAQCGASGAVKCVSGKCRVDKAEICTVGEFTGTVAATENIKRCAAPTSTKNIGQTCTANAQCTSGYCNGMVRICADPGRFSLKINGQTCTENAQCISAYCNITSTPSKCAIPPGKKDIGDACTDNNQCESGLCKTPTEAGTVITDTGCSETVPPLCNLKYCSENSQCASGYCKSEFIGSRCRPCTSDSNCDSGKTCQGEVCVSAPPSITCDSDAACGTGKACINSVCLTGKALGDRTCRNNIDCASKYCARTLNDPEDEESGTFRSCSLCGVDANCDTGRTCSTGVCQ